MLPQTWAQVTVILAAVLPGFVYQVSRRRIGGPHPDELEFSSRVLRAVAVSAVFAAIYGVVFGPAVATYLREPEEVTKDVRAVAAVLLVVVVLVPWVSAWAIFQITSAKFFQRWSALARRKLHLSRHWDPTPSAWDFAFNGIEPCWVRVLTKDGRWIGGWFGEASFASSFPDPQEIFIEVGHFLDADGTFTERITAPGGVFVRCADIVTVDFLPDERETEEPEEEASDDERRAASDVEDDRPT